MTGDRRLADQLDAQLKRVAERDRLDALNAKEGWTVEERAEYDELVARTGYDPAGTLDDES